jgi:hypothetical protein
VTRPVVELLYFEGCPSHEAARELIERIAVEEAIDSEVRLVAVTSVEEAEQLRFLGSPTVRVNGHDIEPGADRRRGFSLACRVYGTESGRQGVPPETWVRAALRAA